MSPDRVTYIGHATTLIELDGVRLLTDPMLRGRMLGVIVRDPPEPEAHLSERLDAVLVSHLHHDHLDLASLSRIGNEVPIVVPPGGAKVLQRRGFARVTELGSGEKLRVGDVELTATEAVHDGRRHKIGPPVDAIGYVARGARHAVYFAGDTDLFDGMADLAGQLDAAMLPIAGWGPKVGKGHLDPRSAAQAAAIMRPRLAIPIHWGTLLRIDLVRRREEFLRGPAERFRDQLAALAPGVEAAVLDPGDSVELAPRGSA